MRTALHADERLIKIPGKAGHLEAILSQPNGEDDDVFILCHPHPLHEGTMHNKVITSLARATRAKEKASLRFNYRGIGQSTGHYEKIEDALEDAQSVLEWVKSQSLNPLGWMGFSFGAYVAGYMTAKQPSPKGVLMVAPSINNMPFDTLSPNDAPWHVIQGDEDEIVSAEATYKWVAKYPQIHLTRHPGVGHFFHGHLDKIQMAAHALMGD